MVQVNWHITFSSFFGGVGYLNISLYCLSFWRICIEGLELWSCRFLPFRRLADVVLLPFFYVYCLSSKLSHQIKSHILKKVMCRLSPSAFEVLSLDLVFSIWILRGLSILLSSFHYGVFWATLICGLISFITLGKLGAIVSSNS